MRTGFFTGHFANGRYAISIIATYYIEIKKSFCNAWTAVWKVPRKKSIPNFRQIVSVVLRWAKLKYHWAKISHKKYRWFCGERNQKTAEPKFSIQSIGGFAVSDTEKPPQRKKSIGGFTVNKTEKRLKKFYQWFFGDFDWQLI